MTDPQTPATEAGRRDHDEAWNDYAESEYHMTHDNDREGCGGCAAIAAIEAEARADALREAADAVRALDIRSESYGETIMAVLAIFDPQP